MGLHLISRALTNASKPTDLALGDMRIIMIDWWDKRWCRRVAGTRKSDGMQYPKSGPTDVEWTRGVHAFC